MTLVYCPMTTFTGNNYPLHIRKLAGSRLTDSHKSNLVFKQISKRRTHFFVRDCYGTNNSQLVGRNNHNLSIHNNVKEPFLVACSKEFIRFLKSLSVFLAEQPGELKYIEWPGFQNTVKTAALTLVLVAMLIVVLSSVESGLWYLLALILRKPA